MVKKILGIDMGTNSIGWSFIEADDKYQPLKLRDAAVRIFSTGRNPKNGESFAVERRLKRGQRRRRDRYLQRKHDVMCLLIRYGLMPADPAARKTLEGKTEQTHEAWEKNPNNPYMLRAKAAQEQLESFKLGRALFHLNQRRGFKSNRKVDKADSKKETEKGKEKLQDLLHGRTLGQYLWEQHQKRETVRFRPTPLKNGGNSYDLYPTREMYEHEFDTIRKTQERHHKLTSEQWQNLKDKIINQRSLRKPKVGKCQLYFEKETVNSSTGEVIPQQERAPLALPSAQYFRIVQDTNNLKFRMGPYGHFRELDDTPSKLAEKREALFDLLRSKKEIPFDEIREKLGLPEDAEFNLAAQRSKLKGDSTYAMLKKYFGKEWLKLSVEKQDAIVHDLLEMDDDKAVHAKATGEWGLSDETAQGLVEKVSPASFDSGYGRFSQKALHDLLPLMRQGLRYHEACQKLGVSHSVREFDGSAPQLPYYAEAMPESVVEPQNPQSVAEVEKRGKISNPTVHIGLRQLQKIINDIIKDKNLGRPDIIRIELARDLKMSQDEKNKLAKEQGANERTNDRIKKDLEEQGQWNGAKGDKLLRVKLWEELNSHDVNDRKCPYTGTQISRERLFSDEVEIEHILPFSRTVDDSRANKTLAMRSVNRDKLNKSPYEAFSSKQPVGSKDKDYSYERILQRVASLPANKRWRFGPDAMKRFENENEFLARQLNDTRYLAKVAKRYLTLVCKQVDVSPGRLTAILRRAWGLNEVLGHNRKNRDDHRQHAVDAVVIALTDISTVQKVMRLNARGENPDKIVANDLPEGFWEQIRDKIAGTEGKPGLVVSHRPDHGLGGALHEDSYYGVLYHENFPPEADRRTEWEKENEFNIVTRKALTGLTQNEVSQIRDPLIRKGLETILDTLPAKTNEKGKRTIDTDALKKALEKYSSERNIRRIRVLKKDATVKIIKHVQGERTHIKGVSPGDIHHVSFWMLPNGTVAHAGVSLFDANKKDQNDLRPHPAAKLLMKIHKGDLMRLVHKGEEKTARVMSLKPSNKTIVLVEHFEGGNIVERQKEEKIQIFISFNSILDIKARKIHVSPAGKVYDPGPLKATVAEKHGTSH